MKKVTNKKTISKEEELLNNKIAHYYEQYIKTQEPFIVIKRAMKWAYEAGKKTK